MTIRDPYKEIRVLWDEIQELRQSVDRYQERWDYYQDFCKAHGAHGITHLVVQRDKYRKALEEIVTETIDQRMDYESLLNLIEEIAEMALDDE